MRDLGVERGAEKIQYLVTILGRYSRAGPPAKFSGPNPAYYHAEVGPVLKPATNRRKPSTPYQRFMGTFDLQHWTRIGAMNRAGLRCRAGVISRRRGTAALPGMQGSWSLDVPDAVKDCVRQEHAHPGPLNLKKSIQAKR